MKDELRDRLKPYWRETAIILSTAFLFWLKDIFSFLDTEMFAGRDLAPNYAFTWLMQQNLIHGEIISWSNQWLLGFPSFKLYPPLFFFLTSGINLLTGKLLGLRFWFKSIVFLSLFLLPLTTYLSLKKPLERDRAFFAGFYIFYLLFVYPPVSQVYQVLRTGMVSQGLAFLLLIPAISLTLRQERNSKIFSGILLGATTLTHPFVGLVGFIVAGSYLLLNQQALDLITPTLGFLLAAPWLLPALNLLRFTSSYSFAPANPGIFLFLLLPLIAVGGYRGKEERSLLLGFCIILFFSLFELPLISQELRFYTYALGLGSILAGTGAYRIYMLLHHRIEIDSKIIAATLLLTALALPLHASAESSWDYEAEFKPLLQKLDKEERGRVLVETSNRSIFDSFTLQAYIPMKTKHWAVNDVHLDSSTSANYILTLEAWISREPVTNPICRTCDTEVSDQVIEERLDDLGIRYVVARTRESRRELDDFLAYRGRYGDYWLFENTEGYRIVEKLDHHPIALIGSYERWKEVNDRLFTSNISKEVVWKKRIISGNYSATIRMQNHSIDRVIQKIRQTKVESIDPARTEVEYSIDGRSIYLNSTGSVKLKSSYFPGFSADVSAGSFNTAILPGGGTVNR